MENLELDKILISESEFYYSKYAYTSIFKKYNLKTVGDLLNDELMDGIKLRCHENTLKQINVLISLLKHKYLHEPLLYDIYLDKKIEYQGINLYCFEDDEKINLLNLNDIFGYSNSLKGIIERVFMNCFLELKAKNNKVILIDLFKKVLTKNINPSINAIIKCYIDSYEKNKKYKLASNYIEELKNQVEVLIKKRDELDIEIYNLKKEIAELENHKARR